MMMVWTATAPRMPAATTIDALRLLAQSGLALNDHSAARHTRARHQNANIRITYAAAIGDAASILRR